MGRPKHIAIIGRGVVGLTTAWKFASEGALVTVFGSRDEPGMASLAAVGHVGLKGGIVKAGEEDKSKPGYVLKAKGLEAFESWLKKLEADTGKAIWHQKGFREYYQTRDEREAIFKRVFANRINHQGTWGNVKEVEEVEEAVSKPGFKHSRGYFLYPKDLCVAPKGLLCALEAYIQAKSGQLVETLVKTLKLGKNQNIKILGNDSKALGSFEAVVVASGAFANPHLDAWGISPAKIKKSVGWKASVARGQGSLPAFSGPDSIVEIRGEQGCPCLLEIRKVRPLVWKKGVVETSFKQDPVPLEPEPYSEPNAAQGVEGELLGQLREVRKGVRFETKDQAPLVGSFSGANLGPHFCLNICHHKSAFVTALPSAYIRWKEICGEPLKSWQSALNPARFLSK